MKQIGIVLSCALVISVFACSGLWAQATAQISGAVRDQSGAVLPGVEVTALQTSTGMSRNTITNETGSYVLPNLSLGPYRIEVALPGFRTFVQTGVVLQVNSNPVINAVLEVGQISEEIEVQANAAMVETQTVGVGQIMDNQRILELPLNGRDVESLITLSGGAVLVGATSNRALGGQMISMAGGLAFGIDYELDGANHMNYSSSSGHTMPFPDALQEFNVRSSGLTAESGRGAAVAAVTKSGTNEFHGDLFEFVRNDLFNAREYFATSGSTLKRNQFGGTLGGPILRDKLFFFGGYQGTTIRSDPANLRAFIPSQAMLAGDWTTFASTRCRTRALVLRAPFVNNRIDPTRFSRPAMNIVNKLPKTDDPCGEFTYGRRTVTDEAQGLVRIDYQHSSKHSLFGRYMVTSEDTPGPWNFDPDNILLAGGISNDNFGTSLALGSTYLIGSNLVNSFRATYNRINIGRYGNTWFSVCDMGVKIYCGYSPTHSLVRITGGFPLVQTSNTDDFLFTDAYDIANDVSLIWTNHQIGFGGGLNHTYHLARTSSRAPGEIFFRGDITGAGLSDFMTGQVSSMVQGNPRDYEPYRWLPRAYVTDAWRLTPKLTINYGVRWEPYISEEKKTLGSYNFDYRRFQQRIKSTVYVNAPAGFYYPGDPGFPEGTSGQNKSWLQFSPRLGLAWDVTGDGRTSVRASYAYSYEIMPMEWSNDSGNAPPFGNRVEIFNPSGGFENPWQDIPGGDPFPIRLDKDITFGPYGLFSSTPYDQKAPRTSTWNLSIQRQLPADSILSMTYMGSITTHMTGLDPMNPAMYIPGGPCVLPDGQTYNPCSTIATTNLRRKLTLERWEDGRFIGPLADRTAQGIQRYSGLLMSLRSQPARAVNINTNYTWSHCIGDYAEDLKTAGPTADQTYVIPGNRRYDFGNCGMDRRHIFNLTAVLESPQFANRAVRALATGWRLAAIHRRSSGGPMNILTGEDRALTGSAAQRVNQILGDVYADRSAGPMEFYLNRNAFEMPGVGTFGNMGRHSVVGPGTWDFDLALSRIFVFRESHRLEFRAEAYNVTNSFRALPPTTLITDSNFGRIRDSGAPRIMQFALKYIF